MIAKLIGKEKGLTFDEVSNYIKINGNFNYIKFLNYMNDYTKPEEIIKKYKKTLKKEKNKLDREISNVKMHFITITMEIIKKYKNEERTKENIKDISNKIFIVYEACNDLIVNLRVKEAKKMVKLDKTSTAYEHEVLKNKGKDIFDGILKEIELREKAKEYRIDKAQNDDTFDSLLDLYLDDKKDLKPRLKRSINEIENIIEYASLIKINDFKEKGLNTYREIINYINLSKEDTKEKQNLRVTKNIENIYLSDEEFLKLNYPKTYKKTITIFNDLTNGQFPKVPKETFSFYTYKQYFAYLKEKYMEKQ